MKSKNLAQSEIIDISNCTCSDGIDVYVPDIGYPSVDLSFCNCSEGVIGVGSGGLSDTTAGAAGLALGVLTASQSANQEVLTSHENYRKCNELSHECESEALENTLYCINGLVQVHEDFCFAR
jgi:hypothetical protein